MVFLVAASDMSFIFSNDFDVEQLLSKKNEEGQDENEGSHKEKEADEEKDSEVKSEKIRTKLVRINKNLFLENTSKISEYFFTLKLKGHIQDKTTPPPELA